MSTSRSWVTIALRGATGRRDRDAKNDAAASTSGESGVRELAASTTEAAVAAACTPPPLQADDTLAAELTELAQARTSGDAHHIAARLRAKLGAPGCESYRRLVDVLVERAREHERLGRLAGSDELTGIANRRSFNDALRRELARTNRDHRPMALLLLDLDGLKAINDGMGHAAGDRALRLLARSASEAVRHGDIVARIGGDEFAVLLPNTDASMANAVAQRIRDRLAVGRSGESDLQVSVSIGVAVANEATTRMDLLRNADAELYRDKAAARRTAEDGLLTHPLTHSR
jgi:two-component system, cell cycle response regulator